MSDDQVLEYLRGRGRVEPQQDFIGSVMNAVADAPQRHSAWFAPLLPAVTGIGAVAAVIAVILLVDSGPNVGPPPDPSASASAQQEIGDVLLEEGDVIVMPAVDVNGVFGSITVERGPTREGYEGWETGNAWEASFVELYVRYALDRPAASSYGALSFGITIEAVAYSEDIGDQVYFGGVRPTGAPEPILPNMMSGDEQIEGWIVMEIPEEYPAAAVNLVHTIAGEQLGPIDWRVPLKPAEQRTVDLLWENETTDTYLFTVGDARVGNVERVIRVSPCQKGGAWGVVVTYPDDIGVGPLPADGRIPDEPFPGGMDFLNVDGQWMFSFQDPEDTDDIYPGGYGPAEEYVPPGPPEDIAC